MRVLIASKEPRAREALDLFTYRAAVEIANLAGALGGLDGLVFTAGIGERAPSVRAEICARLAWLGLRLDPCANGGNATRIGAPDSQIDVRVVATDEEQMIARHTLAVTNEAATA
jgi:acetate kinase